MASVNRVTLIGNVGADPTCRYMPNGEAVTNINLATTDIWKDKNGEKQEKTEWHRVAFFGKLAEIAGEYLKKGSQVYVEGRLQTRKWQDKDGQDRYTTEIVSDRMQMLGSRGGSNSLEVIEEGGGVGRRDSSVGGSTRSGGVQTKSVGEFDDFEDDIPFILNMNNIFDTSGKPLSLWRAKYGKSFSVAIANKTEC